MRLRRDRSPLCTPPVKHDALFVFTILTSLFLFAYFLCKMVIIQHFSQAAICEPTQGLWDSEHAAVTDALCAHTQEPEFSFLLLQMQHFDVLYTVFTLLLPMWAMSFFIVIFITL